MAIGAEFEATLGAARRGDPRAIEAIYLELSPLVLGYFRGQRARDPEDLAGEVFVSMMHGLRRFTGDEAAFRSWLLTIAHRRLVDSYRRQGRRPEQLVAVAELADVGHAEPAGERDALERIEIDAILDAVDRLTDDQRAVVLLRALADLPVAEISRVVGKPETAVKALLRRGVAGLRRQMDASGAPTDGRTADD